MEAQTSAGHDDHTIPVREEVERRYLAYALSTIVARALPDVRDGLKPVHRRILFAMHSMGLDAAARMRKSAAVVGEVIGKYHPHGDQAAYDSMVRMAQDFSLRYPVVQGSGNFGSLDGDSPAAMRYTEARLSSFADLLLREIDLGTTTFSATYDGMGEEPDVLPTVAPHLLLNGSSGIAVGMSCSFPPHNLREVIAACRACIKKGEVDAEVLLKHIKGPDFPTGGEILDQPDNLREVYDSGQGSIRLRGTFQVEEGKKGKFRLIVTSVPYSVNKARLIERIAQLIKEKRLKHVYDVRDESAEDVRIVLEVKGTDVRPDAIMAFLYKHTDLQINFPANFIAITPQGVPERLSLSSIIRHFLDFRYEKTTLRLQCRLAALEKRIHILSGFAAIFEDLDTALAIIRSATSRKDAARKLQKQFGLDEEQTDAILEMRLYRLVSMEKDKLLDELAAKSEEADRIRTDLASAVRLWAIIDAELAEVAKRLGDARRTAIVAEHEVAATSYDPDDFVHHEDVSVILSVQGWIRRIKSEVEDPAALKFREGDGLYDIVRLNTEKCLAFFTNRGQVYVIRALDVPMSAGFGEPLTTLFALADGEHVVGLIAPDPVPPRNTVADKQSGDDEATETGPEDAPKKMGPGQAYLFAGLDHGSETPEQSLEPPEERGIIVTRLAKGFCFDYNSLREPTKRAGRRFVTLAPDDAVVCAKALDRSLVVIATDTGKVLAFPVEQVPVLQGPGQGVKMIKLAEGAHVVGMAILGTDEALRVVPKRGKEKTVRAAVLPKANRATAGKALFSGIREVERRGSDKDRSS